MYNYFYSFCLQNFPFVERDIDALTDYQLMCKIFKYLDDQIKKVDSKYQGFADDITNLKKDFNDLKIEIDTKLSTFENKIINEVDLALNNQKAEVVTLLNQYKIVMQAYVDSQIQIVNDRIDEVVIGNITIYNPLSGRVEPLEVVINDLYNSLRYNAITVSEFEDLNYTALAFDQVQISAQNFDLNAKQILS